MHSREQTNQKLFSDSTTIQKEIWLPRSAEIWSSNFILLSICRGHWSVSCSCFQKKKKVVSAIAQMPQKERKKVVAPSVAYLDKPSLSIPAIYAYTPRPPPAPKQRPFKAYHPLQSSYAHLDGLPVPGGHKAGWFKLFLQASLANAFRAPSSDSFHLPRGNK